MVLKPAAYYLRVERLNWERRPEIQSPFLIILKPLQIQVAALLRIPWIYSLGMFLRGMIKRKKSMTFHLFFIMIGVTLATRVVFLGTSHKMNSLPSSLARTLPRTIPPPILPPMKALPSFSAALTCNSGEVLPTFSRSSFKPSLGPFAQEERDRLCEFPFLHSCLHSLPPCDNDGSSLSPVLSNMGSRRRSRLSCCRTTTRIQVWTNTLQL